MIIRIARSAVLVSLTTCINAAAQNIPQGFVVPKCTLSPDGRYGVTVPIFDKRNDIKDPRNSVIDLKTGKVIAIIKTNTTGWTRMGHGGVLPCRWSRDGSLLLWEVYGKWFPDAVVLLKFNNGMLEWQTDITAVAEAESLKQTKHSAPEKYATAKKKNAGWGSAYPEGFSIYVETFDPISLPLRIRATLTADPKQIEGPAELESYMTGVVDHNGKFSVTDFHVKRGCWQQFVGTPEPKECEFEESDE
jgi:hypothetical protein